VRTTWTLKKELVYSIRVALTSRIHYKLNPASMIAFCPVIVLDTTNVLTCCATSSTVAKRFSLFASFAASSRAAGKESPQS